MTIRLFYSINASTAQPDNTNTASQEGKKYPLWKPKIKENIKQ